MIVCVCVYTIWSVGWLVGSSLSILSEIGLSSTNGLILKKTKMIMMNVQLEIRMHCLLYYYYFPHYYYLEFPSAHSTSPHYLLKKA